MSSDRQVLHAFAIRLLPDKLDARSPLPRATKKILQHYNAIAAIKAAFSDSCSTQRVLYS
jgi:hypothetical protein